MKITQGVRDFAANGMAQMSGSFNTVMMHLVEHATGKSAQGHMIKIYINAPVIAALFDDAFNLVRTELAPA